METITKVTARKAYERAKATGDAADWHATAEAIWAYVNKPKVRRGRWPSVFPAPVMSGIPGPAHQIRFTPNSGRGAPGQRTSGFDP